jgi:anti-sigma-K factor RskA
MTDRRDLSEDDDALAAELALGLLTGAEAEAAARRAETDFAFRTAVAAWSERLAAMADEVPEVAPPPRVAREVSARVFRPDPRARGRYGVLERLRGFAFGALAASAVLAVLLLALVRLTDPGPLPTLGATMVAEAGDLRFEAVYDAHDERLVVTRVAGAAPAEGQAHELWLIAPDAAPVSLGLVGGEGLEVGYPEPPEGWVLAVSLEPAGGSPTGAPTGAVLAAA